MQSYVMELSYLLLPALWSGLLIGVCFIATPAKFLAQSLTLPIAMDVRRATFTVWNNAEWLISAMMIPPIMVQSMGLFFPVAMLFLITVLIIQTAVLLPVLNARIVTSAIDGSLPSSSDYWTYIALDVVKLIILAAISWKEGQRLIELFAQGH